MVFMPPFGPWGNWGPEPEPTESCQKLLTPPPEPEKPVSFTTSDLPPTPKLNTKMADYAKLIADMAVDDDVRIPVDATDVEVLRGLQKSLGPGRLRCLWSPVPTNKGARMDYSGVTHVRILASDIADATYALWELDRNRRLGARLQVEMAS